MNPGTFFDLLCRDILQTLFWHIRPENIIDTVNKIPRLHQQLQHEYTHVMYFNNWFAPRLLNLSIQDETLKFIGSLGFIEFINDACSYFEEYRHFGTVPLLIDDCIFSGLVEGNHSQQVIKACSEHLVLNRDESGYYFLNKIRKGDIDIIYQHNKSSHYFIVMALIYVGKYHPQNTQLYHIITLLSQMHHIDNANQYLYFMNGLVEGNHLIALKQLIDQNPNILTMTQNPDFDETVLDYLCEHAATNNNIVELLLSYGGSYTHILIGIIGKMTCSNYLHNRYDLNLQNSQKIQQSSIILKHPQNPNYFNHELYQLFRKYMHHITKEEWSSTLSDIVHCNNIQLFQHVCADIVTLPNCPTNWYMDMLNKFLWYYMYQNSCFNIRKHLDKNIDNFIVLYQIILSQNISVDLEALLADNRIDEYVLTHPKIIALKASIEKN